MLKIRRPLGRLIFNMGIATPGKTVFLIETAPWFTHYCLCLFACGFAHFADFSISVPYHFSIQQDSMDLYDSRPLKYILVQFNNIMMTSSNGNILRVTGPLSGDFTGHRWIPLTKASYVELRYFLWSASSINGLVNNLEVDDLRRLPAHYDVIIMIMEWACNIWKTHSLRSDERNTQVNNHETPEVSVTQLLCYSQCIRLQQHFHSFQLTK